MYIVGYVDDKIKDYEGYRELFLRHNIQLLYCENIGSKELILQWIIENGVTCIIADYDLKTRVDFTGNDLLNYLLYQIPDLPCVILTSFYEQSENKKNVPSILVFEKDDLTDRRKRDSLFRKIINCSEIFSNRLLLRKERYLFLKKKKEEKVISNEEEEEFISLYKVLRSYLEIDDIPSQLLTSSIDAKLDELIKSIDNIINK